MGEKRIKWKKDASAKETKRQLAEQMVGDGKEETRGLREIIIFSWEVRRNNPWEKEKKRRDNAS